MKEADFFQALPVLDKKRGTKELQVCSKQCDECLYTKNKLVSDTRRDQVLYQLEQVGDYFICHKASIVDERVMCRGYFEANKGKSKLLILGKIFYKIYFVDVLEIMRTAIFKIRSKAKTTNS